MSKVIGYAAHSATQALTLFNFGRHDVGFLIDACGICPDCVDGLEQYCDHEVFTYNSPDKHAGNMTYGAYSKQIVIDEHFALQISNIMQIRYLA